MTWDGTATNLYLNGTLVQVCTVRGARGELDGRIRI